MSTSTIRRKAGDLVARTRERFKRPILRRSWTPVIWLAILTWALLQIGYRIGVVFTTHKMTDGQLFGLIVNVVLATVGVFIVWAFLSGAPRTVVKNNTFVASVPGTTGLKVENGTGVKL